MRDLFIKFRKSEDGASLVEYAVALIVVTIVGGAGVIALGGNAGGLAQAGCDTTRVAAAGLSAGNVASGVTVPTAVSC